MTSPIHVAVYNGTERPFNTTTGLGKHIENLVVGLAEKPDFSVAYYVPSERWSRDQSCPSHERAWSLPSVKLPVTRRRQLINALGPFPTGIDSYAPEADWVYAPMEVFCPSKRAKSAVTIHDVYHFEPERRRRYDLKKEIAFYRWSRAIHEADVVFTVSHFTKERVSALFGASPDKIVVIGNGVSPLFFEIAKQDPALVSPLPEQKYYVSLGGLLRKKGAEQLLKFADLLEKNNSSSRLVVIGNVEQAFAAQASSCSRLLIVPHGADDDRIARWIRGATAMLCFSEYEGFGIPALEAMAAGVPVVANRQGALVEVVGDAGMIIDARSSADLTNVLSLELDASLRDRMIEKGYERAGEFTWERCVSAVASELKSRLAGSHR